MTNPAPTAALCLVLAASAGCATPCVDDGLGQKHCSDQASASGTDSATDGATDSATDGGTDTDPTVGTAGGTGMDCPLLDLNLTPKDATIVILVDRSGSMTETFDTVTRWEAVRTTLFDPVDGVVVELEDQIRFGLSLYSSDMGFMGGTCPILDEAPPMLQNAMTMQSTFDGVMPTGDTPTGESLAAVAQTLAADPAPGEKLIVLATDGEPDTCDEPNPQNGQDEAVQAATDAFTAGVETAIISVGDQISEAHLQDMANAGAGVAMGDPDAPFYQALNQAALVMAFKEIIGTARECTFALDDALNPNQADQCTVSVNGQEVPLDDPDGWQLNGTMEMELVGTACDDIQDGDVTVEMTCDCDAVSP